MLDVLKATHYVKHVTTLSQNLHWLPCPRLETQSKMKLIISIIQHQFERLTQDPITDYVDDILYAIGPTETIRADQVLIWYE